MITKGMVRQNLEREPHPDNLAEEWCRSLRPAARLFLLRHMGAEADDLVQEALVLLLRAARDGKVRDRDQAGGYLHGVCRNLVRATRRKVGRRADLLEGSAPRHEHEPPGEAHLDRGHLWACLNRLSSRARAVVLRTFVEDEETPNIAAALGLTDANVRVTRHRALVALRNCMNGDAP